MRFLVDENLSPKLAAHLRAIGHDAVYVVDYEMVGTDDRLIYQRATAEARSVITRDEDFLLLHRNARGAGAGVVHLPQELAPNRPVA